jgi:hypothetical protein
MNDVKSELRKHHFDFGGQNGLMMTTHQLEFSKKVIIQD